MAIRCKGCGYASFPPRADCPERQSGEFEFYEVSGEATLHTCNQVEAAPGGFEDDVASHQVR